MPLPASHSAAGRGSQRYSCFGNDVVKSPDFRSISTIDLKIFEAGQVEAGISIFMLKKATQTPHPPSKRVMFPVNI
jgi:hypothetical protein